MHTLFLGDAGNFCSTVMEPKKFVTAKDRSKIDDRLKSICPIRELQENCDSLKDIRKAKDWKNFFFFFSLLVFQDILSDDILENYARFVNCFYYLSAKQIDTLKFDEIESDIETSVAIFEDQLGREFMTCNSHLCTHAVESVRKKRPLWCTSTVAYESHISRLKNYINRPKQTEHQKAIKHLQTLMIRLSENKNENPILFEYSQQLFRTRKIEKHT